MTVVACLLLLLSSSIAGQAATTASLATGWHDEQMDRRSISQTWLYNERNKSASAMRTTAELEETLVERTSSSSSQRRRLPRLQDTSPQQVPPHHLIPGEEASSILGGPDLNIAAPLHVPAEAPVAPHTDLGSSSKRPYKANRRPRGSLKNNSALKTKAEQEKKARMMQRIRSGERVNRTKPDGSNYSITTIEQYRAKRNAYQSSRRLKMKLAKEEKANEDHEKRERSRRDEATQKEQQQAQLQGRPLQGPPAQRGRSWRYEEQEQEREQARLEEVRQHEPSHLDGEPQYSAEDGRYAPHGADESNMLTLTTPEMSSSSWTVPDESLPKATHQFFPPRPSLRTPDLGLSLSVPGSSTSGQMTHVPPAASTREEKRLRLTLSPPEEHSWL